VIKQGRNISPDKVEKEQILNVKKFEQTRKSRDEKFHTLL